MNEKVDVCRQSTEEFKKKREKNARQRKAVLFSVTEQGSYDSSTVSFLVLLSFIVIAQEPKNNSWLSTCVWIIHGNSLVCETSDWRVWGLILWLIDGGIRYSKAVGVVFEALDWRVWGLILWLNHSWRNWVFRNSGVWDVIGGCEVWFLVKAFMEELGVQKQQCEGLKFDSCYNSWGSVK